MLLHGPMAPWGLNSGTIHLKLKASISSSHGEFDSVISRNNGILLHNQLAARLGSDIPPTPLLLLCY